MTYVYIALSVVAILGGLSFLSYILNAPKPKFRPGDLVAVDGNWASAQTHYLSIQWRRWARPKGEDRKQWMYSGPLYMISRGIVVRASHDSEFSEKRLFMV